MCIVLLVYGHQQSRDQMRWMLSVWIRVFRLALSACVTGRGHGHTDGMQRCLSSILFLRESVPRVPVPRGQRADDVRPAQSRRSSSRWWSGT
jgi:hypothetical protein